VRDTRAVTLGDGTDTHLEPGDPRLDTRSVVEVLRATPSLRTVDLRGAALDDLDALVSAVEMHPSLTHLHIDGLSASQRTRVVVALTRNRNRLRVTVAARRPDVSAATITPATVAPRPDAEALAHCAATLRAIESQLTGDHPDDLALREVRQLCARVTAAVRERARNDQRQRRAARAERDRARLDDTGIRQGRRGDDLPVSPATLEVGRNCYVCKARYRALDAFYDQLCPACADFNRARRTRTADLRGRVVLVTGGRVKIGRCIVLKLLRAGARVIATTRFPHDAWRRYAMEPDFEVWRDRLEIHGLDLRFLSRVEAFAHALAERLDGLDVLISNAAQTVARPPDWYAEMLRLDAASVASLPAGVAVQPLSAYAPSDGLSSGVALFDTTPAALDRHAQPVDVRAHNSWRALVGEVSTHELVSVHAVTTLAPFVLLNALRPCMARSAQTDRFVVLVSAVEGQFERRNKTPRHPHTNMAKAALNMLARTSASELAHERIWCCAVDTGWITDENPLPMADAMAARGFAPPLDEEDGAARVLDPVLRVMHGEAPAHGVFLKDYVVAPW
jgi:NAD(P)-dependent dehydrogenase (short-subunit alcohol dehydrogenase family)